MTTLDTLLADLPSPVRDTLGRAAALAEEVIAPRADDHDRQATFPAESFQALFRAGLLAPTVPRDFGGLGWGRSDGSTFALWMLTKLLARADLSIGRCWEGHTNSLVLIDALGTAEQKRRWFTGVVERGEIWVAWSGEPSAPKPGEPARLGTTVTATPDGWLISGSKVFATSASGADHAILLVSTEGPGGARHHRGNPEGLLMLACDLSDPTITIDPSWWDPIGMRATASHLVRFDQTFVPRDRLIGRPGAYLLDQWQTAFVPHYAASFLGAAEAAYDYTVKYVAHQRKASDPYVQHRVASMTVNLDSAHLWLHHVARLWDRGARADAALAGIKARHLVEHWAEDTVDHCIRACGARALIRPSPIERILRDLTFYLRHDNDDHVLATIGRAVLGEQHDVSFYKP
ncbi:MAG TPA: acyl-CoA dehydrogenase family protein [Kofleriaceae bacterium]|nr:acyl-CoA dehydrogenase family protein [Kofleriaceae bacterium]